MSGLLDERWLQLDQAQTAAIDLGDPKRSCCWTAQGLDHRRWTWTARGGCDLDRIEQAGTDAVADALGCRP